MGSCASSNAAARSPQSGLVPLLVLLGFLWTGAGKAQEPPRDTFDQANAHGLAAYEAHRYEEALIEFQAAYSQRQLPGVLYNIAQTHRRLGHAREALETYELYLRADAKANAETVARVRGYMDQMQALLAGTQGLSADINIVSPVPEAEPAPLALSLVPEVATQPVVVPPPRPVYRRWWFWTSIGAAALTAVGVGVGVGLGTKAGSGPGVSVPAGNAHMVTF